MSSMRNVLSRRPHKERSQPKARERWGILEKHKDYKLRARDYNLKKQKLAVLSRKARNRNEDEFAFGMLSANKAQAGTHGRGDERSNRLSHDVVKLLKSQDAGYLRVVAGRGRRELQKLEETVGMASLEGKGRKVVFVSGDDDGDDSGAGVAGERAGKTELDSQTTAGRVGQDLASNLRSDQLATSSYVVAGAGDDGAAAAVSTNSAASNSKKRPAAERDTLRDLRAARMRRKRRAELHTAKLETLKKRQREIMAAADALDLQRAKMARTVGGVNKDGVKWRIRERKR